MNELSGKRSQAKGRAGELELCRLLQEYGYPVQPGEAVSYGSTPDLTGLDGIHAECKRCEKQAIYEWIEQAQRDSECVAFFVALVTAAVVMLGLSLFTGVEGLLRLALTAGAGLLAGAVAWATARPVLEDDASGD